MRKTPTSDTTTPATRRRLLAELAELAGLAGMAGLARLAGLATSLAVASGRPATAAPHFDVSAQGLVVMLRHAVTEPGIGDPRGYTLDDCSSQRLLSADGRAQARRLGATLAAHGLRATQVKSSRWCRCLDTARLGFGHATPWPALDSFFDEPGRGPAQTATLREALAALAPGEVVVWVTHQVNITALAGSPVAMGEAVVLRGHRQPDGSVRVQRLGGFVSA